MTTKQQKQESSQELKTEQQKDFATILAKSIAQSQKKYDKNRVIFSVNDTDEISKTFPQYKNKLISVDDDGFCEFEKVKVSEITLTKTGVEVKQDSQKSFGLQPQEVLNILENLPQESVKFQSDLVAKFSKKIDIQKPKEI
jgi:hypothetical protein